MGKPNIRELQIADIYGKEGFVDCLSQIALCTLSRKVLEQIYLDRQMRGIITLVAVQDNFIIGTASVIIERKYIHNGGSVAHVEDVAVIPEFQGMGIGKMLVEAIVRIAKREGCYKAILNCLDKKSGFYEHCGFYQCTRGMRIDL